MIRKLLREGAACTWLFDIICVLCIYTYIYIITFITYVLLYIYMHIYYYKYIYVYFIYIYIYTYTCLHMQLHGVLPTRRVFVGSSWNSLFQSQAKSLEDESTGKSPNKEAGQLDPCGLTRPSRPTGVRWKYFWKLHFLLQENENSMLDISNGLGNNLGDHPPYPVRAFSSH